MTNMLAALHTDLLQGSSETAPVHAKAAASQPHAQDGAQYMPDAIGIKGDKDAIISKADTGSEATLPRDVLFQAPPSASQHPVTDDMPDNERLSNEQPTVNQAE